MVRNFGKGGKGCKKMKNSSLGDSDRVLLFKELGQDYAVVKELLGGGRCRCLFSQDGVERLCIIRGNMRKRSVNRIFKGDLVLVSLRDFQDNKADIIHLYNHDEVRSLISYNEIEHSLTQNIFGMKVEEDVSDDEADVVFEDI
jgi:translation initiation factor 1A